MPESKDYWIRAKLINPKLKHFLTNVNKLRIKSM